MMLLQVMKFGLVGAAATAVHLAVGLVLIYAGWHALGANIAGFVTAFCVSFVGHFGYSFADQSPVMLVSLWRFAVAACGGFLLNKAILSVLIFVMAVDNTFAFAVSTLSAAALTYFLSKQWAFKEPEY